MAVVYGDYLYPEFIAMAHRGGSLLTANLGIENTVRAFANAVELGFTYLETDVHATADGHLVAFHDPNLERVTGYDRNLHDLSLDEVLELRVGDREPIPTLHELFETFPEARFNIDIKHAPAMIPLSEAIRSHGAERRVCVGSFSRQCLRRFRALMPDVPTSVSTVGVAALAFGQMPPNGQVFQMPMSYPVGPVNVDLVTPRSIERIHATGRKVHVWTIDDPTTMHQLIDWGVDGIITDRPDSLKDVLSARGMWSTR
ncbi:MAG TPA: glycerophosphodiester phosphodiesterase [Arachnia sp.]|jgi:glycerophosphoryl diester phosphodiesterase|nr:glycerophosphodiester phosphodiesterase [Arachnia sp.]